MEPTRKNLNIKGNIELNNFTEVAKKETVLIFRYSVYFDIYTGKTATC